MKESRQKNLLKKKLSDEQRQKLSELAKENDWGKRFLTEEAREAHRLSTKGVPLKEDHLKKLRLAKKGKNADWKKGRPSKKNLKKRREAYQNPLSKELILEIVRMRHEKNKTYREIKDYLEDLGFPRSVQAISGLINRYKDNPPVSEAHTIVWTIQSIKVLEKIERDGFYHCCRLDEDFQNAYRWMVKQMEDRIGKAPTENIFPIWAWRQYGGTYEGKIRKPRIPNLSDDYGYSDMKKGVRLKLKVSFKRLLFSDFELWHLVLNDSYSTKSDPEWEDIFDLSGDLKDKSIQATFWQILKDDIVEIKNLRPKRSLQPKYYKNPRASFTTVLKK